MKPTAAIATLGCKTNQFESAAMEERLRGAGYRIVDFAAGADLVVVNTCTVTSATDAQSRNLIRRARRLRPACRVVVTGCYAQVDPEALRAIPGVSLVLGNDEKEDLLCLLEDQGEQVVHVAGDPQAPSTGVALETAFSDRSRAFLQIQNGCDAFCSYCIIPFARGRSRSVPPDQVLNQLRRLTAAGYPEVVLTGIHIGGYGRDLPTPTTLLQLIRRIEKEVPVPRLRLGSIEPTEIDADLIETVAGSDRICGHFHIPLQSGDDDVLRRMNRDYRTADFGRLVGAIRERIPDAAIGIDVIAGFPGETGEQFERTRRFIENLPVTNLHVFPFSRRPGTPAAGMPDQVPGAVARERAARLRAAGRQLHERFAQRFVGRTLDLVVEGGEKGGRWRGLSENYLTVRFSGPAGLAGRLLPVEITGNGPDGLEGVLPSSPRSG